MQLKFDVTAAASSKTSASSNRATRSSRTRRSVRCRSGATCRASWPASVSPRRTSTRSSGSSLAATRNRRADRAPSGRKAKRRMRELRAFSNGLEVAMDRLAADDLRGVELQLDEMQAIYGAEPRRSLELLRLSVHGARQLRPRHRRLRDEASPSYAAVARSPTSGPWVPLANLYFARHQYDIALKTLLRPRQATNGAAAGGIASSSPKPKR